MVKLHSLNTDKRKQRYVFLTTISVHLQFFLFFPRVGNKDQHLYTKQGKNLCENHFCSSFDVSSDSSVRNGNFLGQKTLEIHILYSNKIITILNFTINGPQNVLNYEKSFIPASLLLIAYSHCYTLYVIRSVDLRYRVAP